MMDTYNVILLNTFLKCKMKTFIFSALPKNHYKNKYIVNWEKKASSLYANLKGRFLPDGQ